MIDLFVYLPWTYNAPVRLLYKGVNIIYDTEFNIKFYKKSNSDTIQFVIQFT